MAFGKSLRIVCDRIPGSKWCSIWLLVTIVALSATLVPHRAAAAQTDSLVIETVPPIKGITFRLDGDPFSTNEEGVARVDPPVSGRFELGTRDQARLGDSRRIEFVVWSDGVADSSRVVDIEGSTRLQVGFRVDYLIAESFRTSEGDDLKPKSVGPFVIVDDAGESTTLPGSSRGLAGPTAQTWERFPPGTRWLPGVRIVSENRRLKAEEISYRVRWAYVEGERIAPSTVPFTPSEGGKWNIEVDTSRGSLPRALVLVPLLAAGLILWLVIVRRIRRSSQPSAPGGRKFARFVRRHRVPRGPAGREFVRIKLRTGRTVEGWRTHIPGADPSEAVNLAVTSVWGPDGSKVTSQPTDSFLFPSQIIQIDVYEGRTTNGATRDAG
jgi:hypothetical protein